MKNLKVIITVVVLLIIIGIGVGIGIRMLPFLLGVCCGFLFDKCLENFKNKNK